MSEDLEKDFYNYLAKSDSTKSVGFVINQYINEKLKKRDDFTLKFVRWHNVNKYELPNELTLEEKLQIFKTLYYE